MRTIFKALLGIAIIFMVYLCWSSIMTPIRFEEQKIIRDQAVIERLIDIRKAQIEFNNQNKRYTESFDTLIYFVRTAKIPVIMKQGVINDYQLEKGLTEQLALTLTEKDAARFGVYDFAHFKATFRRDTSFISVLESVFGKDFAIDSIAYVPFGNGARFEMEARIFETAGGLRIPLFEARTPFTVYLQGLDQQEIHNLIDARRTQEKFEGLKVGDITAPNNNAGNWE